MHRRSAGRQEGWGREIPSSKLHKLERKKGVGGANRRGRRRRERGRNSDCPEDFGAREQWHATRLSAMAEGRPSDWLNPCGRRTSLVGQPERAAHWQQV